MNSAVPSEMLRKNKCPASVDPELDPSHVPEDISERNEKKQRGHGRVREGAAAAVRQPCACFLCRFHHTPTIIALQSFDAHPQS
jgi:hypothetical protein